MMTDHVFRATSLFGEMTDCMAHKIIPRGQNISLLNLSFWQPLVISPSYIPLYVHVCPGYSKMCARDTKGTLKLHVQFNKRM